MVKIIAGIGQYGSDYFFMLLKNLRSIFKMMDSMTTIIISNYKKTEK